MIELVKRREAELVELCHKHHVKRLDIFGSAADGSFKPGESDLDFLVDYLPDDEIAGGYNIANAYLGLLADLQDLFELEIDLVMERAIKNPYFRNGVEQSRQVIYAA